MDAPCAVEATSPAAEGPGPGRDTGARLGLALLAYMMGVTLIITLLPFHFDWPTRWRVMFTGGVIDVVANVLLFLPLGFLFQLARREGFRHSTFTVLWVAALLSMAIESAQLFEAERYTSVLDVATNAGGAWLGAIAFERLAPRARVDGALIGRLSLELPLMGLIYLLVPLLWLNSLASGSDPFRGWMVILLGVFGAVLLGGIQRFHFGPNRALSPWMTGLAAVVWFVAGAFPSIPMRPWMLALGVVLVALFALSNGLREYTPTPANRRFEVPLLESAAPAYATYLAALTVAPLLGGVDAWQVGLGFPGVAIEWTKVEILRFLEQVAAFTLLGYMVAEFRGRAVTAYGSALPRLARWGATAALLGEGVRGFHAGHGASVARGIVLLTAALYGGWLYYLQRAHVVRLLGQVPASPGTVTGEHDAAALAPRERRVDAA
ncbi:MAG: VanZ family protein [Gemmatimonadaceae bacterium]|nr:VanZ family protein [Gemmatimonadaceae bacterium]